MRIAFAAFIIVAALTSAQCEVIHLKDGSKVVAASRFVEKFA